MKSLASLVLILVAPAAAQEPPAGDGPQGTSQVAAGELRFDVVGRADVVGVARDLEPAVPEARHDRIEQRATLRVDAARRGPERDRRGHARGTAHVLGARDGLQRRRDRYRIRDRRVGAEKIVCPALA